MSPTDQRPGSTLRFFAWLALVVCVVLVGAYLLVLHDLRAALDQRLAHLRAEGIPTDWSKIAPPPVPAQDNAAILYQQVFDRMGASMSRSYDGNTLRPFLTDDPPGSRGKLAAQATQIVERSRAALDLVKEASRKRRCRFPLKWHESPYEMTFPHYANLRTCARLLAAEELIAAEDGDASRALEACGAGVRMARHVASDGPTLIGFLVSVAIHEIVLKPLPEVLARTHPDAAQCRALFDELERAQLTAPLRKALALEVCSGLWWFDTAERRPSELHQAFPAVGIMYGPRERRSWAAYLSPMGKAVRLRDEIAFIDLTERSLRLAAKPYRDATHQIQNLEREINRLPRYYSLSRLNSPVYGVRTVSARDRNTAICRGMQVALALKAYQGKYGRYPDSLAALRGYPGWRLPEDPFSGKNFGYRRQGTGFVLYSWGLDLKDDGGRPIPKHPATDLPDGDMVWEVTR